ncbi:MAG: hypothetical protein ACTHW2_05705 [Tissierella sp.]|uniref:hypothetical protein n=1 Tax=Tissierella sp. TaxID=41274 RepID=UPI003F95E0A5
MFKDFMNANMLTTFGGLVTAVIVIVQFTKPLIKKRFKDSAIRVYTFTIALILTLIFHPQGFGLTSIILTIINSIMITITSLGGYEVLSDPMAKAIKK